MHKEIITHFKYLNTIIDEITHLRLFKNEYEQRINFEDINFENNKLTNNCYNDTRGHQEKEEEEESNSSSHFTRYDFYPR